MRCGWFNMQTFISCLLAVVVFANTAEICKCPYGSRLCEYLCQEPHGCVDFTTTPWDFTCCNRHLYNATLADSNLNSHSMVAKGKHHELARKSGGASKMKLVKTDNISKTRTQNSHAGNAHGGTSILKYPSKFSADIPDIVMTGTGNMSAVKSKNVIPTAGVVLKASSPPITALAGATDLATTKNQNSGILRTSNRNTTTRKSPKINISKPAFIRKFPNRISKKSSTNTQRGNTPNTGIPKSGKWNTRNRKTDKMDIPERPPTYKSTRKQTNLGMKNKKTRNRRISKSIYARKNQNKVFPQTSTAIIHTRQRPSNAAVAIAGSDTSSLTPPKKNIWRWRKKMSIVKGSMTLDEAEQACGSSSSSRKRVFIIDSQDKQDAAVSLAMTTDLEAIGIGVRNQVFKGWIYTDGRKLEYEAWAPGFPGFLGMFCGMSRKHGYDWTTAHKFDGAICAD